MDITGNFGNAKRVAIKYPLDFFDRSDIKELIEAPGGSTYVVLYMKILAKAAESNGYIRYEKIGDTPEEELSFLFDEDIKTVRITINALRRLNLVEDCANGDFFFPDSVKLAGTSR